jgi:hypothetical protein
MWVWFRRGGESVDFVAVFQQRCGLAGALKYSDGETIEDAKD